MVNGCKEFCCFNCDKVGYCVEKCLDFEMCNVCFFFEYFMVWCLFIFYSVNVQFCVEGQGIVFFVVVVQDWLQQVNMFVQCVKFGDDNRKLIM